MLRFLPTWRVTPEPVYDPDVIPELVVFDVDGTLVDWDGTVSPATRQVLDELRARRIPIAVATGRPQAIAAETLAHVGGAEWIVCGNGSTLTEVATGRVLRDNVLPGGIVEPLVREIRRLVPDVGVAIEAVDPVLREIVLEEPGFARRVPEPSLQPPVDDALAALANDRASVRRIIAFHDDYDARLADLAAIIAPLLDDRCQVQYGGLAFVDVSPRGDDKSVALQVLVDHLGIDVAAVVAFGDGRNDIEMLRWAGTGVAMGNAYPEAKAAADVVTASVDQDGVAAYLVPRLG